MNSGRYQRVKSIFQDAVSLEPSERAQFLQEACVGDSELLREVESLLSHHSTRTILPTSKRTMAVSSSTTLAPHVKRLGPKGQLALGAAICAVLLGLFGWWQRNHVAQELRQVLSARLNTLINSHVAAFEHWANLQRELVESWARDPELRNEVQQLVRLASQRNDTINQQLRDHPSQQTIRATLKTFGGDETEYVIWNDQQRIISESAESGIGIGKLATRSIAPQFGLVMRGETVLFVGNTADVIRDDYPQGKNITDVFVAAPIYDQDNSIVAVTVVFNIETALLMNTVAAFSEITSTSETYAFNKNGLMLSDSRFDDQLKRYEILPESAKGSALQVTLRDPGGDLTKGFRPNKSRESRPLTHMARHATSGEDGQNLDGYRNYLGHMVVGTWRWLPEFEAGFAMEMSHHEAYATVRFIERQFQVTFILLVVAIAGVFGSSVWITRVRKSLGTDHQLGQYTLGELVGEGGMGRVYKASHSFLKRPCAVKLLKPELMTRDALARFEREVQLASMLTHPNTIEIYDFGTTPEGAFYYVMEYLEGLDLEELIQLSGPLPWPRAVFLLEQISASLREAHAIGMVHRDIKPQNIVICQLGGESDFIKVLDFGLAKDLESAELSVTSTGLLAGTPLYMAPERWRDSSNLAPSSDIFSLGVLGYRLLTATDAFSGDTPATTMQSILTHDPIPPSTLTADASLPEALDQLVMECLAKDPDSRPVISDVHLRLQELNAQQQWNHHRAQMWWANHSSIFAAAK